MQDARARAALCAATRSETTAAEHTLVPDSPRGLSQPPAPPHTAAGVGRSDQEEVEELNTQAIEDV